ncbi:MAG: RNA methyltransferase [Muribaculum sp.]|nr:RNA methyltransferase [Muribaculaceae bacterium]MCM1081815.1 RNA methyltransferase [Muribaculum sp.]
MEIIEIKTIDDPRVSIFCSLTEAQIRNKLKPAEAVFIAESPKVIRVALDAGCCPVALLCEKKHIDGDARDIIEACGDIPIYTGTRDVLASLTGYTLTRGVLCAMRRPAAMSLEHVCRNASRICVIDGVSDTTNIGAIFRSAAALGVDAIALSRTSCDPLNRRSVRVSMGAVFLIPWAWVDDPISELAAIGFKTAAMALCDDSIPVDAPQLEAEPRLAIILGTEGDGLAREVIEGADYTVRIPMSRGVDSLNVAAASAVAFWQLRKKS